jgi:hypothetical protein
LNPSVQKVEVRARRKQQLKPVAALPGHEPDALATFGAGSVAQ